MNVAARFFQVVLVVIGVGASSAAAAPGVQLSIRDGRVWLETDRATAGQILAEWARVGGTRIVNGDRVNGEPLTLVLRGVPELKALEVVLRTAGGFIASARTPTGAAAPQNLSRLDRIVVLPASAHPIDPAVRVGAAPPGPISPPFVAPPPPSFSPSGGQRIIGSDGQQVPDDQEGAPPPTSPPAVSTPPVAGAPAIVPTVPQGVATPGIVPPARPPSGR
jgi:hypothetical protein